MPNDWFQFRHFMIRQDRSAMKVGTDGVLLGAWAGCEECLSVLDVGTGTGLMALMIAQRNQGAIITALEIDPGAASQASENVRASLWPDRIEVIRSDFRDWEPESGRRFDLIICNPPFFTRALKNPDNQRATARHDDELPLAGLIVKSAGMLSGNGKLALILPAGRVSEAKAGAMDGGLFVYRQLNIRGKFQTPVKRVLLEWGREERVAELEELVIETDTRGVYTEAYKVLTGEFYLGNS